MVRSFWFPGRVSITEALKLPWEPRGGVNALNLPSCGGRSCGRDPGGAVGGVASLSASLLMEGSVLAASGQRVSSGGWHSAPRRRVEKGRVGPSLPSPLVWPT